MSNSIQKVLELYITGKDKDQPAVLENIYLPQARVIFKINSDTISFPPLLKGNIEIAKVLSADFNKKYNLLKTCYLSHQDTLQTIHKTLAYPWAKLYEVIETLASWPELIPISQLLKKGDN
jgi:hypothetical protein